MFQIRVVGIDELIKKNNAFIKMLDKGDPVENLMKRIVKLAKHDAPRKTGALVQSITYERVGKDTYKILVTAKSNKGAPYPVFLEFGTRYITIGTPESPRVYKSSSGKTAKLPYVRSAIYRLTTKKDIQVIVDNILQVYKAK